MAKILPHEWEAEWKKIEETDRMVMKNLDLIQRLKETTQRSINQCRFAMTSTYTPDISRDEWYTAALEHLKTHK